MAKRPFSTEAQIGHSYTVEKGLFRLNIFRLSFPAGGSSRKTQSKKFHLFLNPSHRSSNRKTHTHTPTDPYQVPHNNYHTTAPTLPWLSLLLLLAASQRGALLAPLARPHTHTRYHTVVSHNSGDAALAITAVASRRKSAWRTPSSARKQRVSHDGSSARYRCHFDNNGYACCSFGGFRLSATPRT